MLGALCSCTHAIMAEDVEGLNQRSEWPAGIFISAVIEGGEKDLRPLETLLFPTPRQTNLQVFESAALIDEQPHQLPTLAALAPLHLHAASAPLSYAKKCRTQTNLHPPSLPHTVAW